MTLENGIYLEFKQQNLCLSHIKDNHLIDIIFMPGGPQPGDILVGRIAQKISAQKFFVDIGLSKPALLQKPLKNYCEGEKIAVQLKRLMIPEGRSIKNAEVTDRLHFTSANLSYSPAGKSVIIAGAIQDKVWRQELKQFLENRLESDNVAQHGPHDIGTQIVDAQACGGVVVYKSAYNKAFESLAQELQALQQIYHQKCTDFFPDRSTKHKIGAKAGHIIHATIPLMVTYLLQHKAERIFVADADLISYLEKKGIEKDRLIFDPRKAFLQPLGLVWQEALDPAVPLDQGGFLLIEEGLTLTAIDVNTTSPNGYRTPTMRTDADLFEFSKAALIEALRQVYIRKIGGIILIDLPKFNHAKYQKNLIQEAKKYEGTDLQIMGFTKAGLLEMTKRKSHLSLKQLHESGL